MPVPTLASLLTTQPQPQLLAKLLAYLAPGGLPATSGLPNAPGLPVSDWVSGGVANTIAQVEAQALADLQQTLANIAGAGFLDYAPSNGATAVYAATPSTAATATSNTFLDLLAYEVFQTTRVAPVYQQYNATLTLASGLPPVTISANQLWFVDVAGHRFNNLGGGTLTAASPLTLTWQADTPGSNWSSISGGLVLQTPIPGVTVSIGSSVQTGLDMETDAALVTRCRLKWASLAGQAFTGGGTAAAYQYWAVNAPNVPSPASAQRVFVLTGNPDGPGTLRVYVASAAGVYPNDADPSVVAINAQLQALKPITATVVTHAATALTITLTGTVHYKSAYLTAGQALAQLTTNLGALAASLLINDTVYFSAVEEALMLAQSGVQNIRDVAALQINGGTADIALGAGATYQIAVFSLASLVFVGV